MSAPLSLNDAVSRMTEEPPRSAPPTVVDVIVNTADIPAKATLSLVQLERDHALVVIRGAICEELLLNLRHHLQILVDLGVRYVVMDLAEVTVCPPQMVAELASVCTALSARQGWLRSITTAPCVALALDSAELTDLLPIYQAARTEFRHAS